MENKNIKIRFANESDTGLILQFIKDLAEYEKLSDNLTVNDELIRKNLFGSSGIAECLIAEFDDKPCGFAVFFHNFSTFKGKPGLYLEDLFVQPDMRGKGIGKALLVELATIAKARDCAKFEWSVLDWNQPAIDFYKSIGAVPMSEWTIFRLEAKGIERLSSK
jgi:GNAT superfamily N-acetyltransferase